MTGKLTIKVFILLSTLLFLLSATACRTNSGSVGVGWGNKTVQKPVTAPAPVYEGKKNGPPAHAPAHGYRAKHNYRYYPDESVYVDTDRGTCFYLDNGTWQVSVSLPHSIRLSSNYVSLELDTDKPYRYYSEHQEKYPSKQAKNKNKNKNMSKNKNKNKNKDKNKNQNQAKW